MERKSIKNNHIYIFGLTIIYTLFQFISTFNNANLSFTGDEFGGLVVPSVLAGNDWSVLIQDVNYYGYGFRWIYCILFRLSNNPAFIYTGILMINVIIMSVLYSLCLIMLDKRNKLLELGMPLTFIFYLIPIAMGTKSPLYSEYSLFFVTVLWTMTLIKLLECQTKAGRRVYSGLLAFLMVYMLTLHERSLAFVMAVVLSVVIDWIYEKKCFISLETAIPVYIIFNWMHKHIKSFVIDYFWGEKIASGSGIANTEVSISNPTWFLESKKNFKIFFDCILSNIATESVVSLGIYLLMFVFAIAACVEFFRKEKKWKDFYRENHILFLLLMVSFFTISATIVGIAMDWGTTVSDGNIYGYKGYAYVRYYNVWSYIGMFAQLVLVRRLSDKIPTRKLQYFTICLFGGVAFWFYHSMWPVLENVMAEYGSSLYFERIGIFNRVITSIDDSILFTMVLGAIFLFGIFTKKYTEKLYILGTTLCIGLGVSGFQLEKTNIQADVDSVYDVVNELEEFCEMPKEIYYLCNSRESRFLIQFTLNRHSIQYELPDESLEEAVVITNDGRGTYADYLLELGYSNLVLDNGKYLWAKGDIYQDAIIKYQDQNLYTANTLENNLVEYGETVKVLGKTIYQTEPGVVFKSWLNSLAYGQYECVLSYQTDSESKNEVVDVYSCGEKVDSVDVLVDETGTATANFIVDSRYLNYIYFTLSSNSETKIRNVKTEYTCIEKYSSFGNGIPEEFDMLKNYIDQIGMKKPIRFLSYYNIIELDSNCSIMEEIFDCDDVSVWNYKRLQDCLQSEDKDCYIILSNYNDEKLIFDLMEAYDILCVTEHYVLLAYRDDNLLNLEQKKGIQPLNRDNSLSLFFLRQTGTELLNAFGEIILPAGCYEISIDGSEQSPAEEELFSMIRANGNNSYTDIMIGEEEWKHSYVADGTTTFYLSMNSSENVQNNRVYITRKNGLQPGDRIYFDNINNNSYTCSGLYPGDEDGAWTSKKKTSVTLPIAAEDDISLCIRMKSIETQKVEIYADNELLDTFDVTDSYEDYEVRIPKKYVKEQKLNLTVRSLKLYELPDELLEKNGSSNMKKAGIKLQSMEVK